MASSDDVPGPITKASTWDRLMQEPRALIPKLLEANEMLEKGTESEIPFHLLSERRETIHY